MTGGDVPHTASPATDPAPRQLCPYCAESIPAIARKCRFCGEFLEDTQREGLGTLALKHIGLLTTAIVSLLAVLKLLAAARFNVDVALVLLARGGAAQILSGVILTTLPVFLWLSAQIGFVWALWSRHFLLAIPIAAAALFLGYVGLLWIAAGALLAATLVVFLIYPSGGFRSWVPYQAAALVSLLVATLLFPYMWLAPEEIDLRGPERLVAYRIAEEGGWTTLLLEDTRTIAYVPSESIIARRPCTVVGGAFRPIRELFFSEEPTSPPCVP